MKIAVLTISAFLIASQGICHTSIIAQENYIDSNAPYIMVEQEPPAEIREEVTRSPGQNYAWVKGNWKWDGHWVWVKGRWVEKPHPSATWVSGHWEKKQRHHGWVWITGHWE